MDGGPIISGGRVPFDRYGATQCRNRNLRVYFMFLVPEREMTTRWGRLLGWRDLARCWELVRENWSRIGTILVSSYKWSIDVIVSISWHDKYFCWYISIILHAQIKFLIKPDDNNIRCILYTIWIWCYCHRVYLEIYLV